MNRSDPRKAALSVLNELEKRRVNLDQLLEARIDAGEPEMPRRDRALARAIIYGVLRQRALLDWHIAAFASQPIRRMKPEVLNILRIGLFQMLFFSKIPQSAAVNTSVEMAKAFAPQKTVRFVNGLLRNAGRNPDAVRYPDPVREPVGALAVTESFPEWLIRRWKNRYGMEETRRLCRCLNTVPPVTIRANTLKISREALKEQLCQAGYRTGTTPRSAYGITLPGLHGPIPDLPGFAEGFFQVQDEAAQLAAIVLAPRPGEQVLDACAGRGGKTGHIAQCMQDSGQIVAMDRDARKLDVLAAEMRRLGVRIVEGRRIDLEDTEDVGKISVFDRVLVDAPCSGLGVIRRNPDIKWAAGKNDFSRYRKRQLRILRRAAAYVRPGGVLVYAVCSMEPEETDAVISAFCAAENAFSVEPAGALFPGLADLSAPGGCLRLMPHRHQTDGFFIARLVRSP